MNILEKIRETAKQFPDRIVFISRAGTLTYGELWSKSSSLASFINKRVNNREPIMVYGHKSPYMLVCFLACVRSGHAYCPVDIGNPKERVSDIADAVSNEIILSPEYEENLIVDEKYEIVDISRMKDIFAKEEKFDEGNFCKGDDTYYIIFTSGSSGKPKGVKIPTDALNNYLDWSRTLANGISEGAIFLNQAPFSFDLSVMDLYTGLATGSTIVGLDKKLQQKLHDMINYILNAKIEYWVSTPSFVDMCLGDENFNGDNLPSLKAFLFCGETLSKDTSKHLIRRFPNAKVINTYGPTESTVCVTDIEITEEIIANDGALPIGLPKPGTDIYLDPESNEIIIIGDSVSSGYYKDEEKTKKSFYMTKSDVVDLSKVSYNSGGLVRAYRTGDIGHFDETGMLYCDGRIDHQIKLHGYRIELGDIEANLTQIDGISSAAVLPRKRNGKVEQLAAFVVRDGEKISDDFAGRKYVREALRENLPGYMVPKRIKFIDGIPLTNNGKADRKKLEELL